MKDKVLAYLEKTNQNSIRGESYYGFKDHWRECRSLLNSQFREMTSCFMAIMGKNKQKISFPEEHQEMMNVARDIPHEKITDDYVLEALPDYLEPGYSVRSDSIALLGQIMRLYYCLGYFLKNLDHIPLDAQLRIDRAMMEISLAAGVAKTAGI